MLMWIKQNFYQLARLDMKTVAYHSADRQSCLQFERAMQTSLLSFAQIFSRHFHQESDSGVCAVILVVTKTNNAIPKRIGNVYLYIFLTNGNL